MNRLLSLLTLSLLAAPLALAQAPAPPAPQGGGGPDGPAPYAHQQGGPGGPGGQGHGMRGGFDGQRDGMRDEGGPDGFRGLHSMPGTWWRNQEVVTRIGLSPDQVKRIDGIFMDSRIQLIHMHASLEEEQLRLEPLLSANPINEQSALAQIAKIADTRADLEKANAKMLLSIRGVLTGDQWTKLQQRPMGPGRGGPDGGRRGGMRAPAAPSAPPQPAAHE